MIESANSQPGDSRHADMAQAWPESRHRQPRELWILFCRVLPYTWCDAICGWSRQATQWRRSGLALVAMCMGSRTPVQSAQQHSGTLALKELNGKTGSSLIVSVSSDNNWNFVNWNFNFRAPRQWWNIPCLSSLMLNRIHRDYCNDQDSTVKTLPKDLNSGFVDSFRLSQVPELNSRCGHLCLIHMYPIVCVSVCM